MKALSYNFDAIVRDLQAKNPNITAIAILTLDGQVLYQTNNWNVVQDAPNLIAAWREKAPSIYVQGIKYSTLSATDERLVATNVSGMGHIIMATARYRALLMAYVTPQGDTQGSYVDVSRAAAQLGSML
ncbi:MAG: profilin family protein [Candidatus Freyarchaeota archaeon]|nr:profilin family protein [Candidatus Freyarchaeota archaeon]